MKNKNVSLLVAVAAVLAALAWMTSHNRTPESTTRIGHKLLPKLAVNAVDEIIIASATETVRVAKAESGWKVPDHYDYPANFETIRQLMLKLEQLKIGQVITVSDRQREQMELTAASATAITLKTGGNEMLTLLLGANRIPENAAPGPYGMGSMPDGRYVAIKDDPSAYLIGDVLREVSTQSTRWMDTSLLDVSAESVTDITIENPDDGAFTVSKGNDEKLNFAPADESTPFDDTKSYALTGALSYLTIQDIADPALDDEALGFKAARRFTVKTKDGTRYDLQVSDPVDASGDRNIRIAVAFDEPPSTPPAAPDADKKDLQAEADRLTSINAAKTKAAELNAKLSPWTFRISSYKANTFASTHDSLVKKPEPPAEAETPDAAVAAPEAMVTAPNADAAGNNDLKDESEPNTENENEGTSYE